MGILRDESGNVLVLPVPWGVRGNSKPSEQGSGTPSRPEAAGVAISSRRPIQHCSFVCVWCEAPIALPHETLGLAFGHPSARRIEARSIATVCNSCNHVADYSLFRGCHGFDTRHKLVSSHAVGRTILVETLHCEEKTCAAAVPFYVTLSSDPSEDEGRNMVARWQWKELACASGHRIRPVTLTLPR